MTYNIRIFKLKNSLNNKIGHPNQKKEKQYNNNIGITKVFELCDLLDLVSKLETSEKCTRTFLSEISVQFLG